jgi:hypothetical protein
VADAFIHLPRNKQPSFGPRAVKGTFVGYDPHSLAYVVKVNKSFYRSGHVKFNEDLSSRQRPSAAQEQAYQQVFNDMDQDATLTQATQTFPTVVRDVPIEYDDGEDFPDDGLTEEIKADGDAIKPTSKVREAVSITASAPASNCSSSCLYETNKIGTAAASQTSYRTHGSVKACKPDKRCAVRCS